jgi:hypothetical protein
MSRRVPCAPSKRDLRPTLHLAVEVQRGVADVGTEAGAEARVLPGDGGGVERRRVDASPGGQRGQLVARPGQPLLHLAEQPVVVEQVPHPDATAGHLVLVGRADAPPGGADRRGAPRALPQRIEVLVPGEDDVRRLGDDQLAVRADDAPGAEGVDLRHQHRRIEDHAVADDAGLPAWEDAAGMRVRMVFCPPTTRVCPALLPPEPDHDLCVLGEQVDDLALSLVAPLGTDHHHVRHDPPAYSPRVPP